MARKIVEAVAVDKRLRGTFIGIIVSGIALISIIVYAGLMRI